MGLIDQIARAIAKEEGYFSQEDTIPKRLQNPGDLSYAGQPGAHEYETPGRKIAYAKFDSLGYGLTALYRQLWLDVSRGATLATLIASWAPPNENNTSSYLENVKQWTGIQDENIPLMNLIEQEWLANSSG